MCNDSLAVTDIVPFRLSDGKIIYVEATFLGGEEDVSSKEMDFSKVSEQIKSISNDLYKTFEQIKPDKAKIEFGVEISIESGNVTALFAKGSGKSMLKITLEWGM